MITTKTLAAAIAVGGALMLGGAGPTLADPPHGYGPPPWVQGHDPGHRGYTDRDRAPGRYADRGHDHRVEGPYAHRQGESQLARIRQGEQDGQLTRGEADRLQHRERHLQNVREKAWANGRLSPHEARHLHNLASRDNDAIWRLTHNGKQAY